LQERQRGKNLFRENLKKGDIELETKTFTKNKGLLDINIRAKVLNINGESFIQAVVRDITEKKMNEEIRERFFNIFGSTPDFVGFADARDKHIIYINRAGRKMVGIGEKEDVTKFKIPQVHPDWTNKLLVEEIIPTAIRKGLWKGEAAFLHKDGHEIPVSMVLNSHKNANGEVEIFSTISRDITEEKEAEEKIKESEEKFRAIFENAGEGILIADAKTKKFAFANPRICKILGYKEKELLKLKVDDIHPKKDLPHVMMQFKKQLQKKILTSNLPVLRKNKKVIFCDITATPLILNGKEYLAGFFLER